MTDIINISFANTQVDCPHCGKTYDEYGTDEFTNKINRNKKQYTTKKCDECKETFGITFDYKGLVAFDL